MQHPSFPVLIDFDLLKTLLTKLSHYALIMINNIISFGFFLSKSPITSAYDHLNFSRYMGGEVHLEKMRYC